MLFGTEFNIVYDFNILGNDVSKFIIDVFILSDFIALGIDDILFNKDEFIIVFIFKVF